MKTPTLSPEDIVREARRRGITMFPVGDNIRVRFVGRIDPAFEAVARRSKPALLVYLRKRLVSVTHLAKQVMAGEFSGANDATRRAVIGALREFECPACQSALERLQNSPVTANENRDTTKTKTGEHQT